MLLFSRLINKHVQLSCIKLFGNTLESTWPLSVHQQCAKCCTFFLTQLWKCARVRVLWVIFNRTNWGVKFSRSGYEVKSNTLCGSDVHCFDTFIINSMKCILMHMKTNTFVYSYAALWSRTEITIAKSLFIWHNKEMINARYLPQLIELWIRNIEIVFSLASNITKPGYS